MIVMVLTFLFFVDFLCWNRVCACRKRQGVFFSLNYSELNHSIYLYFWILKIVPLIFHLKVFKSCFICFDDTFHGTLIQTSSILHQFRSHWSPAMYWYKNNKINQNIIIANVGRIDFRSFIFLMWVIMMGYFEYGNTFHEPQCYDIQINIFGFHFSQHSIWMSICLCKQKKKEKYWNIFWANQNKYDKTSSKPNLYCNFIPITSVKLVNYSWAFGYQSSLYCNFQRNVLHNGLKVTAFVAMATLCMSIFDSFSSKRENQSNQYIR